MIVFDLRNEFHANRMKFGNKKFLTSILTPLRQKVKNFGRNWSSRAENLAVIPFLHCGFRKKWSQDGLPTNQIPGPEDFADNSS